MRKHLAEVVVDRIVAALTRAPERVEVPADARERGRREIVHAGSFEEVNAAFQERGWADGLPIVPPTIAKVERFLAFTDRQPDEVIAVVPPSRREATVWSVAVNGVMAGCRPEYMPVLLAVAEALCDPHYGLEHSGSTAGWAPLITLNGPIIDELGFNCRAGVMRPGNQANTSVGRFLSLFVRNVAGFLPGSSDMGTFGTNFYLVLAENEHDSPWPPLCVDRGFPAGTNLVTVNSVLCMGYHVVTEGTTAKEHLDVLVRRMKMAFRAPVMCYGPEMHPQVVMPPVIARLIAAEGYSKADVQRYLFENARVTAREFDRDLGKDGPAMRAAKEGRLPALFGASDDPERMLPVCHAPEEILIVVSGDPMKNRVFTTNQAGYQGTATSKEIRLPRDWPARLTQR